MCPYESNGRDARCPGVSPEVFIAAFRGNGWQKSLKERGVLVTVCDCLVLWVFKRVGFAWDGADA